MNYYIPSRNFKFKYLFPCTQDLWSETCDNISFFCVLVCLSKKFTFFSLYLIIGHYEECMGGGRVLPNVPKDLVIVGSEKGGMKRPLEGGKFYLIIE